MWRRVRVSSDSSGGEIIGVSILTAECTVRKIPETDPKPYTYSTSHISDVHPGGQAILTLRALVQSERFDPAWTMLSQAYRQEVTVPDNVVAFPHKRAA